MLALLYFSNKILPLASSPTWSMIMPHAPLHPPPQDHVTLPLTSSPTGSCHTPPNLPPPHDQDQVPPPQNQVTYAHISLPQDQVALSLASLSSAMNSLSSGNLSAALHHSSQARDAAETSFSDPSILALLYFPDDQKFAIYIPLFLPVGLPLVVAYLDLVKKWRKTKDVKVDWAVKSS